MSKAAWIGTGLGYTGWVLALAVVVLSSGDTGALLDAVLPALVISLGLFGSVVVAGELLHQRGDRGAFLQFVFGRVAFDVGLLGELLRHWILPRLAAEPGALETIERTGGLTEVPMLLGWPLALVGAAVLLSLARRLLRTPPL